LLGKRHFVFPPCRYPAVRAARWCRFYGEGLPAGLFLKGA
jgi:hypothetical protein